MTKPSGTLPVPPLPLGGSRSPVVEMSVRSGGEVGFPTKESFTETSTRRKTGFTGRSDDLRSRSKFLSGLQRKDRGRDGLVKWYRVSGVKMVISLFVDI